MAPPPRKNTNQSSTAPAEAPDKPPSSSPSPSPSPGQMKPMQAKPASTVASSVGSEGTPGYQGAPRTASLHSTNVLHQQIRAPATPARVAMGGFAVVLAIGYFTLVANKQPEATPVENKRRN